MAAPEGYTELGRIGFVGKGNYASGTTYRTGDVVYYNGSTWVALKDNLRGVTPAPGANWKYMARGFAAEALSAVTAKDTSGVLGTAGASVTSQALVDAIADKVMTKLIEKSKIVNNLLATDATTVLSGPMGKSLDEKIGKVISDLAKKHISPTFKNGYSAEGNRGYITISGKTVSLNLGVYSDVGYGAGEVVATIPTEYAPSLAFATGCYIGSALDKIESVGYAYINTAGDILIADSNFTKRKIARLVVTYQIA